MITVGAELMANALIKGGWEFCLTYHHKKNGKEDREGWEADFTRRMPKGLWDNHVSGYSKKNPSRAIMAAYWNIINGKMLK